MSLIGRLLLIQRPLMVCNWSWFGRTVTGLYCNCENWRRAFCTEGAFIILVEIQHIVSLICTARLSIEVIAYH